MKMTSSIELNLKTDAVIKQVSEANKLAMRDTVVEVTRDAVRESPWETGHNRRSMVGEVSGMGVILQGADAEPDRFVDDTKIEGGVYGTSGYSGFLEVGTSKMAARPYIKPAMDKNFTAEKFGGKVKEHLE